MKYYDRWEPEEIQFLKDNYEEHGPDWCADKLSRTYSSVANRASFIGLKTRTRATSPVSVSRKKKSDLQIRVADILRGVSLELIRESSRIELSDEEYTISVRIYRNAEEEPYEAEEA